MFSVLYVPFAVLYVYLHPQGGGVSSLWLPLCFQSADDIQSCMSDSDFLELGDTA